MASQEQLEKMLLRQNYHNSWHTDLCHTMSVDCSYCCLAVWCAPCVSYLLRKRALYDDMSRYTCCAGYFPCSGKCGESNCPEFCLWTEVCFCFGNSVSSTRFLLQDQFDIQTTQCDNCIIGFMICVQQLACIFSIIACIVGSDELNELSRILSCLAELVYCSVCACMQTQHKIELDKRDGKLECDNAMTVPPIQQMSRIDQPVPPSVGYPHSGGYGYPPAPYPYAQPYPPLPPPPPGYPHSGSHHQGDHHHHEPPHHGDHHHHHQSPHHGDHHHQPPHPVDYQYQPPHHDHVDYHHQPPHQVDYHHQPLGYPHYLPPQGHHHHTPKGHH